MDMQLNLFAEDNRLEKLTELGDSLLKLNLVNWESFVLYLKKHSKRIERATQQMLLRCSYDVQNSCTAASV